MSLSLLIKALSSLIIAVIGLIIILVRKSSYKKSELIIGIILIILCLGFSIKEFYHAVNPEIENITVNLDSYYRPAYKIGYDCTFTDNNGENYNLYIDPLTLRKNLGNGDNLIQNRMYEISYDVNEQIIISIRISDS